MRPHRLASFALLALVLVAGNLRAQWYPRATVAFNAAFTASAATRTINLASGYFGELGGEHEITPGLYAGASAIIMGGLVPLAYSCTGMSRCKPSGAQVRGAVAVVHKYLPSSRTGAFVSATMGAGVFRFRTNDFRAVDALGPGIFSAVELMSPAVWGISATTAVRDHYAADPGGTPFNILSWTIGFRSR